MSEYVILLYRLRPTVDRSAYEHWVREADAPYARARPTVLGLTCIRVVAHVAGGESATWDYCELLEVTDLPADQALTTGAEADALREQWLGFVADFAILRGEAIVSFGTRGSASHG